MTTAERMNSLTDLLSTVEEIGFGKVTLSVEDFRLVIEQAKSNQVSIVKQKNGIPTVIEYNGERFTYDSPTTFRGGVQHRKKT